MSGKLEGCAANSSITIREPRGFLEGINLRVLTFGLREIYKISQVFVRILFNNMTLRDADVQVLVCKKTRKEILSKPEDVVEMWRVDSIELAHRRGVCKSYCVVPQLAATEKEEASHWAIGESFEPV